MMDTAATLGGLEDDDVELFEAGDMVGYDLPHPRKGDYKRLRTGSETMFMAAEAVVDEEDPVGDSCCRPRENDGDDAVSIWHRTLIPDSEWNDCNGGNLAETAAVKLFKLFGFTAVGLVLFHLFVIWVGWERDHDYNLTNMILFDANLIALDAVVFFVVGRLYRQRGVDHLAWILTATVSALWSSWSKENLWFLHNSLSLYAVHCIWPWQLWVFIAGFAPMVLFIIYAHFRHAYKVGVLNKKCFEIIVSFSIFLFPYAAHPNFHLHHYYAFWLFGMHANFNVWWSRAAMAWSWGQYINGIAVYGRDPILTCAAAFYHSTNQRCPFVSCALIDANTTENLLMHHDYQPMVEPDWRNCSGYVP